MSPLLEVENLQTEFHLRHANVRAVDGVSFSVEAGECVGLVGESGCGKSTTGLSIMRLLPSVGHVVGGRISLDGRDLASLSEHEMQTVRGNEVAMIFQDPMTSLNPTWTIGRQIVEAVLLHRDVTKEQARERAIEVLTLVGMPRPEERLRTYPHQLSGGLRQRVMIAIALACEPKLLIADEPTTALDVTIQAQILNLIDELRERLHMGVVLITHDLGVIAARADRTMVMYAGKIAESSSTSTLFSKMRHPYTEALMMSIPRLDQDRALPLSSIPGLPPDLSDLKPGCRFAERCRYATDVCRVEEPTLEAEAGDSNHLFACYHPVEEYAKAIPVEIISTMERSARATALEKSAPLVEVASLTKDFRVNSGNVFQRKLGTVKAVSEVSFTIRAGETFGLVGESGCGKTTVGRLLVTLEHPTGGEVRFDGQRIDNLRGTRLRRQRGDLQLMFQDPYASLDPRMRVGAILQEPLIIQKVGTRSEQRARVAQLLNEVGLSARAADLYPHEFSGGQRQRIGLARALALNPRVIVADEPVSALDVSIQAQILNLMRSLQERHGLTYLVISHDLSVVKYVADTIGVMYLGKIVEIGPSDDVYAHPAHPYTRGLIDAIPIPDPSRASRQATAIAGELPSAMDPPSGCRFRTRCPFAQEICSAVEPPLRAFGTGHRAACHFPLETPIEDDVANAAFVQAHP